MSRTTKAMLRSMALLVSACGPSCEDFDRAAHEAVEQSAACDADSVCVALPAGYSCVPGIECWIAVNAESDTNYVVEAILEASSERRSSDCGCVHARCDGVMPPVACVAGRCDVTR